MPRFLLLPALILALAGCAGSPSPAVPSWTLHDNPRLPTDEIAHFYEPDKFAQLQNQKYAGYVIIEGEANDDHSVRIDRIAESFPDHSRDERARRLVATAKVSGNQVGSHLAPRVEMFVVFYQTGEAQGALVYGRELPAAESKAFNKSVFMKVIDDSDAVLTPNGPGAVRTDPPTQSTEHPK